MPNYTLSFELRPGYLYACVKCETQTVKLSDEYLVEIVAKCREVHCHRLLLEKDIAEPLSIAQLFLVAEHLANMQVGHLKIAVLDRQSKHLEDNDFEIMAGNNRGINSQIFVDHTAAEEWLLSSS